MGDVLLAINGQSLAGCTLADAVHLLQEPEDIVTLKISKETQLLGTIVAIPLQPGSYICIFNTLNTVLLRISASALIVFVGLMVLSDSILSD